MPEADEFELILKTVQEIAENVQTKTDALSLIYETNISLLTENTVNITSTDIIVDDNEKNRTNASKCIFPDNLSLFERQNRSYSQNLLHIL